MHAYVHALRAWGLFNYMLQKYDLFIAVVCSVKLIYLTAQMINVFGKFHLCLFLHQMTLTPTLTLKHTKVIIHLYIHVLNKFNQIFVGNDLHIGRKC